MNLQKRALLLSFFTVGYNVLEALIRVWLSMALLKGLVLHYFRAFDGPLFSSSRWCLEFWRHRAVPRPPFSPLVVC